MLHVETVNPDTLALLKQIQSLGVLSETRLVGGTALALHLGHRRSIDLDFFGSWGETNLEPELEAITNRGSKKDFIDVAVLLDYFSLKQLLELYHRKYPQGLKLHVLRSLVYFEDAEETDMPLMLKPLTWEAAKERISDAVREVACK